jgi:hypothetical protein
MRDDAGTALVTTLGNHFRHVPVIVIGPRHPPLWSVARYGPAFHPYPKEAGPCFARPRLALPRPSRTARTSLL